MSLNVQSVGCTPTTAPHATHLLPGPEGSRVDLNAPASRAEATAATKALEVSASVANTQARAHTCFAELHVCYCSVC